MRRFGKGRWISASWKRTICPQRRYDWIGGDGRGRRVWLAGIGGAGRFVSVFLQWYSLRDEVNPMYPISMHGASTELGTIQIAPEVLGGIAGVATVEAGGGAGMRGG